jgi:beta-lactamase regulating signal transducer with metallopeptidase domain
MNPQVQHIGWMLVHSVWEDILAWCLLQVALRILARKSPQVRYLAACLALAAMAILPWLTFDATDLSARLRDNHPAGNGTVAHLQSLEIFQTASGRENSASATSATPQAFTPPQEAAPFFPRLLPVLVALWLAGLVLSSARLWLRWCRVRRLIRQPLQLLAPAWRERFDQLVQISGVDRIVRLGETAAVSVPIVAGWLKPVILLPLGVATSLPAEQIETILLHELAHISRHDYLINLLQNIVETVFFYHPAVWSASRRIRLERELACDDQTIQWCKNPRTYAAALAGFEEFRHQSPLLAATGEGDLFARIRRILVGPQPERRGVPIFAITGFCGVGIYLASMILVPLLAAEMMTDKERVAKIQALQLTSPQFNFANFKESVRVTGTIRTDDGKPLPTSLKGFGPQSYLMSSYPNGSAFTPLYFDPSLHTFYVNAQNGRIELGIWADGYVPLQLRNLYAKDGKLNLNLELKRGFPARVRVTDPSGQPLEGVEVTATTLNSVHQIQLAMPPVRTDSTGMASFGNVDTDSEIFLIALKPGWQMTDWTIDQWSSNEPLVRVLQPATVTSGMAIDQATRQPISGAAIILAARRGSDLSNYYYPDSGQVLAHSDEKGRFELKSLNSNYSYWVYVQAPGYQTTSFPIQAGDRGSVFELPPGLYVRGKILDPDGKLKRLNYKVELRCDYNLQATPQNAYGQTRLQTLSKLGPDIPFIFHDLPKGRIEFFVNRTWYPLNLETNKDDFVIDLGAKNSTTVPDESASRPIAMVFKRSTDQVSPTGTMDIEYLDKREGVNAYNVKTVSIKNGIAKVDLPTPTSVNLRADGLNGYWFPPDRFDVPAGTGAFTHEVHVSPAGVIYGTVTAAPDMKRRPFLISPVMLKKPPGVENFNLSGGGHSSQPLGARYVTSPLPFGGTYVAVLQSIPSYFVSSPALVDAEHPLVMRDMNLEARDSLMGKVVDENNNPIAFQEVELIYQPTEEYGFSSDGAFTRRDGTFTISHMNFAVPGNYELEIDGAKIRVDGHTPQPVVITVRHLKK